MGATPKSMEHIPLLSALSPAFIVSLCAEYRDFIRGQVPALIFMDISQSVEQLVTAKVDKHAVDHCSVVYVRPKSDSHWSKGVVLTKMFFCCKEL